MNSPRSTRHAEFDEMIGRELKNWSARQNPPASARAALLKKAAEESAGRTEKLQRKAPAALRRLYHLLFEDAAIRRPDLPYAELTRWLHAQAAWQHLGNDRRAVRFVC